MPAGLFFHCARSTRSLDDRLRLDSWRVSSSPSLREHLSPLPVFTLACLPARWLVGQQQPTYVSCVLKISARPHSPTTFEPQQQATSDSNIFLSSRNRRRRRRQLGALTCATRMMTEWHHPHARANQIEITFRLASFAGIPRLSLSLFFVASAPWPLCSARLGSRNSTPLAPRVGTTKLASLSAAVAGVVFVAPARWPPAGRRTDRRMVCARQMICKRPSESATAAALNSNNNNNYNYACCLFKTTTFWSDSTTSASC